MWSVVTDSYHPDACARVNININKLIGVRPQLFFHVCLWLVVCVSVWGGWLCVFVLCVCMCVGGCVVGCVSVCVCVCVCVCGMVKYYGVLQQVCVCVCAVFAMCALFVFIYS